MILNVGLNALIEKVEVQKTGGGGVGLKLSRPVKIKINKDCQHFSNLLHLTKLISPLVLNIGLCVVTYQHKFAPFFSPKCIWKSAMSEEWR